MKIDLKKWPILPILDFNVLSITSGLTGILIWCLFHFVSLHKWPFDPLPLPMEDKNVELVSYRV